MAVKPNDAIAGYTFAQKLGEGSTGMVWLAREKDSSLPVTIKLLKPEVFPPSTAQATYEQIVVAVNRAGRLTHQSLAQVRTTFHHPRTNLFGIVSEYLDGQPLERLQLPRAFDGRSGASDPRLMAGVLTWFQQLAAVLAWLHTNGLVHGAVKASNIILLTSYERPVLKLLDLCWTHALGEAAEKTPLDDQLAAAKVLQTVIVAASPGTSQEKALAAAPVHLLRVLQRALSPDPKQRFPDMGAFFYAIEAVRNELESHASAAEQKGLVPTQPVSLDRTQPTERVSPVRAPQPKGFAVDDLSGGNYVDILPKKKLTPKIDFNAPLIGDELPDPNGTEQVESFDDDEQPGGSRAPRMISIIVVSLLIAAGVAWGAINFLGQEPVRLQDVRPVAAPDPTHAADSTKEALARAEAEAQRAAVAEETKQVAASDEAKQVVEKLPEKVVEKLPEKVVEKLPEKVPEKTSAAPLDESLCKRGNPNACLQLAEQYVVADQMDKAAIAYEKSCDYGKLNGCMKAGELFERTNGRRARRAYEKACDRRIAQACELLSRLFAKGIGGPENDRAAQAFKARACGLGLRSACR
jgi:hypothetical protein